MKKLVIIKDIIFSNICEELSVGNMCGKNILIRKNMERVSVH